MDRETEEVSKSKLSPSSEEELSRSYLSEQVKRLNQFFKKSNDRESLVKGIAKLEGTTSEQVEEKVRERKGLVNEEEKSKKAFKEIAESKGIDKDRLSVSLEKIGTKQEEPINVVPRPPIVRKFRRLIKDADKEYVMSEGEKKILEGYAENKRKVKDQRVGKYIKGLKKEKEEQNEGFSDIIGGMEKRKFMPEGSVNHSSQEGTPPVEHRTSLRQERENEFNKGVVKTALEQIGMDQARGKSEKVEVPEVEPVEEKESFGEKMKRIKDAESKL